MSHALYLLAKRFEFKRAFTKLFYSLKDAIFNQSISEGGDEVGLWEDVLNLAGESAQLLGLRTAGLWGSTYPEESK